MNMNEQVVDDWDDYDKKPHPLLKKLVRLLVCVAVPICVGLLAAYITRDNMDVFDEVKKPILTPPAAVFPIAWSILYVMMGLGLFFALNKSDTSGKRMKVLIPYVMQLILNFSWSIIFFNGQMYGVALLCIVFMWVMILLTILNFKDVSKLGSVMLIPYLAWVTFATYLNAGIFILEM